MRRELATLTAREQKNRDLQGSVEGLELEFRLRLAELKERYARQLLPEQVEVLAVKGLGAGSQFGPRAERSRTAFQSFAGAKR